MTSLAIVPLISELEDAVKSGSSTRRVQMLRQVTDLFLSDADRLNDQQIDVFDGVLVRLVERMEERALAQLSLTLSDVDRAPKEIVRQLAYHDEADVAAPLLARSNRLSDTDLVDIASTRGQQHLLAIATRNSLNEVVTDVLIKRGESDVSHALAKNIGARFSEFGYSALVEKAEKDVDLQEKLGLRLDIPINILKELLRKAAESVRTKLLSQASPELRDRIQAAVDDIAEELESSAPTATDYTPSRNIVLELNRAGQLNETTIAGFARNGQYSNCIVALSLLTAVSVDAIEPLFYNTRPDGLIVACRAAKLSWTTTAMILRCLPDYRASALLDLEQSKQVFSALSLSSAQRTLRFWSARSSAKKPDAPETPVAMGGD